VSESQVASNLSALHNNDYIGENVPWIVVKSLKYVSGNKHGYKLQVDDIIKLGRVRFKIKEIAVSK
jgi:hypothetical protein